MTSPGFTVTGTIWEAAGSPSAEVTSTRVPETGFSLLEETVSTQS